MDISNLKELDKLISLCRKRGVKSIQIDNLAIELSDSTPATKRNSTSTKRQLQDLDAPDAAQEKFITDSLTKEQLLNWSVTDSSELLEDESTT